MPENLGGTTFTFAYNDFEALDDLLRTQQVGVVVMEVMRNERPKNDFLRNWSTGSLVDFLTGTLAARV